MTLLFDGYKIFEDKPLVIATMHGKERIIAPILEKALGVKCTTTTQLNTDVFGTFCGEIKRKDTPLATLKLKALSALVNRKETLVIASEGSFGPHPLYPFIPGNEEIVLFLDIKNNLEIKGRHLTEKTNFNHLHIKNVEELIAFSREIGFPSHGIMLQTTKADGEQKTIKNFRTLGELTLEAGKLLQSGETVQAMTDMRAMNNPTRMEAIAQAVQDLVQNITSVCVQCGAPGFVISKRISGMPCSQCNLPTKTAKSHQYSCKKCGYEVEKSRNDRLFEDPTFCDFCNP